MNRKQNAAFESRFASSFLRCDHPSKKPRLDVSLSQSTVVKKCEVVEKKSELQSSIKFSDPSVWGEDLNENEVEECFMLASQVLTQDITFDKPGNSEQTRLPQQRIRHNEKKISFGPTTPNTKEQKIQSTGQKTLFSPAVGSISTQSPATGLKESPSYAQKSRGGTPLFRAASAGNVHDTPTQKTSGYLSLTSSSAPKFNGEGATLFLQTEVNRFREQVQDLREELQTKDGEVSVLRFSLTKVKGDQAKKNREWSTQVRQLKEESLKKVADLEKQISQLNTDLQFKKMELSALEEKLKQSRDSKIYLNDSPRPATSKKSLDFNRSTFHFENKQSTKDLSGGGLQWGFGKLSLGVHQGSLLAKIVEADIYYPSSPENVRSKTSKVSLFSKGTRVVEQNRVDALSNCFLPLMILYKCESFSTYSARIHLKRIVNESIQSCLNHLEQMRCEGPQGQVVDRIKRLLQKSHDILPLNGTFPLLGSRKWYQDEKGIEIRRMLGLINALVKISHEAAEVILTEELLLNCQTHEENIITNEKSENSKKPEISAAKEEFSDNKSVLYILRDLVSLITCERRTLEYNGVLAGATVLLTSLVERHLELNEKGQLLLLEIMQSILTSCPGQTVVLYCCQFFHAASHYPFMVKKLCLSTVHYVNKAKNSSDSVELNNVDKAQVEEYNRCYVFYKNTCPITVLCYIIQAMDQNKRFLVTDVITRWCLDILTKYDKHNIPYWLTYWFYPLDKIDAGSDCACPWNLSKTITTLLCEASLIYDNERSKLSSEETGILEGLLGRGVLLLNKMLQLTSFGLHLGCIEGQYELFIHTLSMLEPGIKLHPFLEKVMEEMLLQEQVKEPLRKKVVEDCDEINSSIFSIL